LGAATVAGLLVCGSGIAAAQASQYGQGSQSQPPAKQSDKPKAAGGYTSDAGHAGAVNAEEDAAYKAFQAVNPSDARKRSRQVKHFLKYPRAATNSWYGSLTYAYLQAGNTQKMQEYGEKEIALVPNDVSTLALLGQTLPRTCVEAHPSRCRAGAGQAEQFSKQAIEITPTLPKPENLTDEAFTSAKNQTLAMAHSGLGWSMRRGKNAEAIPELEQAVKIDPNPDPVNYYLLGMANKVTSHFDDSVAAFNKCATMAGPMQGTCKTRRMMRRSLARRN